MSNLPPGVSTDWTSHPAPQPFLSWKDVNGQTNWITFPLVKSEVWDEGTEVTEHPVEVGADVGDHVRVLLRRCTLTIRSTNEPFHVGPYMGTTRTNAGPVSIDLALPTPPPQDPPSGVLIVPEWDNLIEIRSLAGALVGLTTGGVTGRIGQLGTVAADVAAALLVQPYKSQRTVEADVGLQPPSQGNAVTAQLTGFTTPEDFVAQLHQTLLYLKAGATLFDVTGTKSGCNPMVIETLSFMRDETTGTGEMLTIGLKEMRIVGTENVPVPIPRLSAGGGVKKVSHGAQTPQDAPPTTQALILRGIKKFAPDIYYALPPATP